MNFKKSVGKSAWEGLGEKMEVINVTKLLSPNQSINQSIKSVKIAYINILKT